MRGKKPKDLVQNIFCYQTVSFFYSVVYANQLEDIQLSVFLSVYVKVINFSLNLFQIR